VSPKVHVRAREWEIRAPESEAGAALAGLRLSGAAERACAKRLSRAGMLHVRELAAGLEIEATSYVGRIQLGDLTVTVVPKLRSDALFRLFRYAYGLRDIALIGEARLSEEGPLFQEFLIAQLYAEARELYARGLMRTYTGVSEDLSSPRGRIDVNRLARRVAPAETTLPCRHYLRMEDTLVNRVLLAGLRLGAAISEDRDRAAALSRVADRLALTVSAVPLSTRLVARAKQSLDRLTKSYEAALALIGLLLDGTNPGLDPEEAIALPGFLFNMNHLFQRLVGRLLREGLTGWTVHEERAIKEMMRYAPGENPRGRRHPRPRPDFMVTSAPRAKVLLDAKYRDLWQHELPREMLYQLSMYALSQPAGGRAIILYPTIEKAARPARIEFYEATAGWDRASVVLQPLDLDELDALVGAGEGRAREKGIGALAHKLVLGPPPW
jgi:5-methylcytosine-specific restriction enzyme subunit McrC